MINWYKKYVNYIVGILLGMLCAKSCNMNRTERWYKSEISKNEYIIDSLTQNIRILNDSVYIYNINTESLVNRIGELQDQIQDLKTTNKHFQRTQNTLIATNKSLIENK